MLARALSLTGRLLGPIYFEVGRWNRPALKSEAVKNLSSYTLPVFISIVVV